MFVSIALFEQSLINQNENRSIRCEVQVYVTLDLLESGSKNESAIKDGNEKSQ